MLLSHAAFSCRFLMPIPSHLQLLYDELPHEPSMHKGLLRLLGWHCAEVTKVASAEDTSEKVVRAKWFHSSSSRSPPSTAAADDDDDGDGDDDGSGGGKGDGNGSGGGEGDGNGDGDGNATSLLLFKFFSLIANPTPMTTEVRVDPRTEIFMHRAIRAHCFLRG
jgi:hypothetical protein